MTDGTTGTFTEIHLNQDPTHRYWGMNSYYSDPSDSKHATAFGGLNVEYTAKARGKGDKQKLLRVHTTSQNGSSTEITNFTSGVLGEDPLNAKQFVVLSPACTHRLSDPRMVPGYASKHNPIFGHYWQSWNYMIDEVDYTNLIHDVAAGRLKKAKFVNEYDLICFGEDTSSPMPIVGHCVSPSRSSNVNSGGGGRNFIHLVPRGFDKEAEVQNGLWISNAAGGLRSVTNARGVKVKDDAGCYMRRGICVTDLGGRSGANARPQTIGDAVYTANGGQSGVNIYGDPEHLILHSGHPSKYAHGFIDKEASGGGLYEVPDDQIVHFGMRQRGATLEFAHDLHDRTVGINTEDGHIEVNGVQVVGEQQALPEAATEENLVRVVNGLRKVLRDHGLAA